MTENKTISIKPAELVGAKIGDRVTFYDALRGGRMQSGVIIGLGGRGKRVAVREDDGREDYRMPADLTLAPAPAESYCLKDGDGDWWVSDDGVGFAKVSGFVGDWSAGEIENMHGIDTAAESYCLKDKHGVWWAGSSEDRLLSEQSALWSATAGWSAQSIAAHRGIDATPKTFAVGDMVEDNDYAMLPVGAIVHDGVNAATKRADNEWAYTGYADRHPDADLFAARTLIYLPEAR